ncbi:nitroreductase family deazaflavin-dependent oxidoreductase [Nocardia lijiangensis]|uniref:nitroreductase family deazaflavin-dependent oxidoreductase n=1 Tax=Nocardia lijiangensis TaxID=299618 RepID=UPI003D7550C7
MSKATRPAVTLWFWRLAGPGTEVVALLSPWWVVVETTGRRSGRPRRVPLARGPRERTSLLLLAVHGRRADWVRNIEADPRVRVRTGQRWRPGTAAVVDSTPAELARFNAYARSAPRMFAMKGEEPVLVRVEFAAR